LRRTRAAFSLVEVVIALGIFGVAILGILALLTPTMGSSRSTLNHDQASQVSEAVSSQIQQLSWTTLQNILSAEVPLYASRDGTRLVSSLSPQLDLELAPRDRFFEITLERSEDWSPASRDHQSAYLALQVRIEWLAFRPDGLENTAEGSRTLAVFNTAVLRHED